MSLGVHKKAKGGKSNWIKYGIWIPWALIVLILFYQPVGVKTIDFFTKQPMAYLSSIQWLILFTTAWFSSLLYWLCSVANGDFVIMVAGWHPLWLSAQK